MPAKQRNSDGRKNGSHQLNCLFGVTLPGEYDWKSRTFGLGTRFDIVEIKFTYEILRQVLLLETRWERGN